MIGDVAQHLAEIMWQREYQHDQILRFGSNKFRRAHLDSLEWAIDQLGALYPDAVEPSLKKLRMRVADRMRRPR